jgi:hypothetical protein
MAALRGRLPQGVGNAEIRNRTRQLRAFKADHYGRLPAGLTELEVAPRIGGVVLLAAADKQLVTIQRTGRDTAVLRVKLPLTDRPAAPARWAWHTIRLALPDHVPTDARLCVSTMRVVGGPVRVDLPWRTSVPSAPGAGHTVALGLDWGVNTLLTGGEHGWKWATCSGCGLASDRDHAAAERIVARGLLAQAHVQTDPKSGRRATTMVVEGNVARARRPNCRTHAARRAAREAVPGRPRNHRRPPSRQRIGPAHTSRRVPDRRAVPAPATSTIAGKRPAGQTPQTHSYPQVGAESGPGCDHLSHPGHLKQPGNLWGFHRAVRATLILPLGDYGPPSHTATPTRNA